MQVRAGLRLRHIVTRFSAGDQLLASSWLRSRAAMLRLPRKCSMFVLVVDSGSGWPTMAFDAGHAFETGHILDRRVDAASGSARCRPDTTWGYVTLGASNLRHSRRFYDMIAREIGMGCSSASEEVITWGFPGFGLAVSAGAPRHTEGLAPLQAEDPEQVCRLYDIAISEGGEAESEPQDRGGGLYSAYFRDPDGNRLTAFCLLSN